MQDEGTGADTKTAAEYEEGSEVKQLKPRNLFPFRSVANVIVRGGLIRGHNHLKRIWTRKRTKELGTSTRHLESNEFGQEYGSGVRAVRQPQQPPLSLSPGFPGCSC